MDRSLPDPRDDWCKAEGRYQENLPATSVVVCFHNEAWSVLLRTVHSILDRKERKNIQEKGRIQSDTDTLVSIIYYTRILFSIK